MRSGQLHDQMIRWVIYVFKKVAGQEAHYTSLRNASATAEEYALAWMTRSLARASTQQVGEVQQVNRQPVAAASRQPRFRLAKRQSILFVNGLGMSSGGVDDDDDLRLAKRGGALGQVLQHPEKVRFIVAGDDDNHAKAGIRGGVNLPGCCGLVEVSFVRRNHRTGGAMCR